MITDHTSICIDEAILGVMIFIFDRPMANFREELLRAQIGCIETAYVVRFAEKLLIGRKEAQKAQEKLEKNHFLA